MKRVCEDCGVELSFRTERYAGNRYVCSQCLDRLNGIPPQGASVIYTKGLILAPLGARFGGQIVDWFISFILVALGIGLSPRWEASQGGGGSDAFLWLCLILGIGYYLLSDALPGGQSVGKRLSGTKVVDASTGAPCSIGQSFGRNALGILGLFDWIFIFGSNRQRLGDKAANTLVVWK